MSGIIRFVSKLFYNPINSNATTPPTAPSKTQEVAKYCTQVILSLGAGKTAIGLNSKAQKHHLPSTSVDLRGPTYDISKLSVLTPTSRLYIVGHCNAGASHISSDEGEEFSAEEFAKMIATSAPNVRQATKKNMLKISLVACYAGVLSTRNFSFAEQLSVRYDRKLWMKG